MCARERQEIPSFFMNSVPKSGTNLLLQILTGLPGVTHSPTDTFFHPYDFQRSFYRLGKIPQLQFGVGHIYYTQEWSWLLKRLGMKQLFLYRDLRDVVVSLSHFVVDKPQYHQMNQLREYLLHETKTEKERLLALIQGFKSAHYTHPSFSNWFKPFWGWTNDDNTLCLSFEELVRDEKSSRETFEKIITFLCLEQPDQMQLSSMIDSMRKQINPSTSGTFRKGKIGTWKEEFDEEIKAVFKAEAGEILFSMGYEQTRDW